MANEFVVKNGLITPTVQLPGATSGTVTLSAPAVAGTTAIALPATAGTIVTTGDTGTVTNAMLAGSIANNKLANSTISGTALGGTLPTATFNVSGTGLSGSATYNGTTASTFTVTSNATSANTVSTIVSRDASGNFSAGTITAALNGNASTASTLQTARTITLSGDVAGSVSFNGSTDVSITTTIQPNSVALGTDTTGNYVATVAVSGTGLSVSGSGVENAAVTVTSNATNANTASTIVARDASGNFSAGTITAALSGNASTASALQTARTISLTGDVTGSVSFDGSGNAAIATTIQPDSVALGTDTTGNYMVNVAAGTGVSVSHTQGEGSTATVSIGQAVGTTDNVTFNNVTVNGTLTSDDITSTNISVAGNATITGNLTVSGTTTTVNSTAVSIADINIELARTATTAAQANGAGLTVTGPTTAATLTYTSADDRWNFNKNLNVGTVFGALSGNASTASTWQTARTLSLAGDLSGSVSINGGADVTLTATIAANSVALGTDTTGNYVADITAGNAITVSGGGVENATITVNHADTSSVANQTAATNTFVSGITFDTYGHVQTITTGSPSGFLTGNQTITLTGDTSGSGATSISTTTSYLTSSDDRIKAPSDDAAGKLRFGFTSWTNNNTSPWADYLHLRSYTDSSGGSDNLVMFRKDAIGIRVWQQTWGSATAYATYKDVAFTDQLPTVNDGTLSIGTATAGATNTTVALNLSGAYSANTANNRTINAVVGPALTNLATLMTTAGAGFIRRGATADTYTIDTNTYLTAESDTLATVTGRGASTSNSVTLSGMGNQLGGHFYFIAYDAAGNHYPHFNDGGSASGSKVNWRLYTGATNSITHVWRTDYTYFANRVESASDMRATLFYDSNDTNYYTDPASTSVINALTVSTINNIKPKTDVWHQSNEGKERFYFSPNSTTYYRTGANFVFRNNSDSGVITIDGSGNLRTTTGGDNYASYSLHVGGTGFATSDFRAPIFYDSNDTNYYVDPTSTTKLTWLEILGGANNANSDAALYISQTSNADWGISLSKASYEYGIVYNLASSHTYGIRGLKNGTEYLRAGTDQLYHSASVRSPIFYDSDNTAYYADPASTSIFNQLTVDGDPVRTATHSGSDFVNGTLVQTDIDSSGTNGDSFRLEATGKSYGAGIPFMFMAEGYLYNNGIINFNGVHLGHNGFSTMKIFNNNGTLAFWWPRVSYWNSFEVRVINAGGSSHNRVTSITDVAEPSGATVTKKVTVNMAYYMRGDTSSSNADTVRSVNFRASNAYYLGENNYYFNNTNSGWYSNVKIQSAEDMRAPIYYDSQDTNYYTDPASTSQVYRINARRIAVNPGQNTNDATVGTLSLWDNPDVTTSTLMFKRTDQLFGTHGAVTDTYATFWNMDSTNRGWIFRYATSTTAGSNVFSIRNNDGTTTIGNGGFTAGSVHARLNIHAGSGSASTTYRDIDMWGNWASGEGHAITASHGTSSANMVGQMVFQHDNPGSRIKWGRLYHSGDQSTYPMHLISDGSSAYLEMNNGSMRAPIFYEYNNTSYYLDPASTTSLRTVGSWRSDSSTWDGEFSGKIQYHSNSWYLQAADAWYFRNSAGTNVATINSSGYIFGSYFNASSGNSENPAIGQIWTQNTSDNYLRKSTPAHFISQLGLVTTSVLDNNDRTYLTDSRGAARLPSYYDDRYAQWDFQNTSDTGAGGDTWHGLLTVAKWTVYDASHRQEQIAFTGDDLKRRTATSDSAWGSWKTIWDSGNLTNLNQLTNGPGYLTGTKVDSIAATSPIATSAATGAVTLSHANSGVTAGTYNNVTVNATGHVTSGSNVSYLTGTKVDSISATSPIVASASTGAVTLSHANSGATAGTYNNVTVNATGHVTSGSNVSYLTSLSFDGLTSKTGGTGTYTTTGDFRAPIFYNHTDTSYYVDPDSLSVMNRISLGYNSGDSNSIGCSNWFRSSGSSGWYNGSYGGGIWQQNSTWVEVYNNKQFYVQNYIQSDSSVRAPIFYDSNDTNYYLDPTNASVLEYIEGSAECSFRGANRATNDWDQSGLTTAPTVSSYDDESWYIDCGASNEWSRGLLSKRRFRRINGLTFEYEAYLQSNDGGAVHYMIGFVGGDSTTYSYSQTPSNLIYHDNSALSVYTNSAGSGSDYTFDSRNGWYKFKTVLRGAGANHYVYHNNEWRLIKKTTTNDQNSYEWVRILVSGYRQRIYFRNMKVYNAHNMTMDSYNEYITSVQGRLYVGADLRTPLFYDSNDTTYYLDPASTSTSLNVRGGIVSGLSGPSGGGGSLLLNGNTGLLEAIPSAGSTAAEIRSGASNGIIFKANNSSVAQISSGGIISSSNITAYGSPSDRKLKENIEPLTNSLQKVMALQGVSFNWKKDTKEHTMVGLNKDIGLIAQNVQQVLPDLVREGEDGTLSLRDRGLIAVLIEAIKEQQSEIDELKALVRQLLAK